MFKQKATSFIKNGHSYYALIPSVKAKELDLENKEPKKLLADFKNLHFVSIVICKECLESQKTLQVSLSDDKIKSGKVIEVDNEYVTLLNDDKQQLIPFSIIKKIEVLNGKIN